VVRRLVYDAIYGDSWRELFVLLTGAKTRLAAAQRIPHLAYIFGAYIFGAYIFGAYIFGAYIFGAYIFGARLSVLRF
jgi:hypothetical protein